MEQHQRTMSYEIEVGDGLTDIPDGIDEEPPFN